jgi:hypothetical protein
MRLSLFEKALPWTGALAGLLWAAHMFLSSTPDDPADAGAVAVVGGASAQNHAAGFALLFGALMLVFFASAARAVLRSGEAGESTYSSVAHGGLLVAAAGLGWLGVLQIALTGAAVDHDAASTAALGRLAFVGWLPALAGLVAAFWGLGLGGLRTAALPRWFAVATVVLGLLGVLGPAAMAVYLLLPLWLVAASAVTARRSPARAAAGSG